MPSILHLPLTAQSGTLQIKSEIPPQPMTLKSVRIEFDDATNAQANDVIHINLPFLGTSSSINSPQTSSTGLPVFVGPGIRTMYDPGIIISSHSTIQESVPYSLTMTNTTGFTRIDLIFEYDISSLSG